MFFDALKFLTIALASFISLQAHAWGEQSGGAYIHAGTLIDVNARKAKPKQTIVIADGMVSSIIDGYAKPPEGTTAIDLKNASVLPGLIDAHVHLLMNLGPATQIKMLTQNDSEATLDGVVNARTTLMAGFTTVQDLGSRNEAIFALRDGIAKGQLPGPRILASGEAISPNGQEGSIGCSGVDECRRVTRDHILSGADVIKTAITGGTLIGGDGPPARFTAEELRAIVETAQSMNRKVAVHAHGADAIKFALRQNVHSIEHGTYLDDEAVRLFRKAKAVLVPTMMAGQVMEAFAANPMAPPAFRKEASIFTSRLVAAAARAQKSGVTIALGTDVGAAVHGQNAQELSLLVRAGLTPMEALRAGTIIAATHLGVDHLTGAIEKGKAADIIAVLDDDPLKDVSVLESVDFVMKAGIVYKGGDI
ncbi:MAG: amidohydrolase family protein [Pseudomonadota bacterium]